MFSVQSLSFALLVLAAIVSWLLLARFVKRLSTVQSANDPLLEDLSRLLISGSGGIKEEWRALVYLLTRGYASIPLKAVVVAGDQALAAWWATMLLLIVNLSL